MNEIEMDHLAIANELLANVRQMMDTTDRYCVIELLARQDARTTAEVYQKLQLDLYWKHKNLPAVVAFSQAGIQHCLTAADKAGDAADGMALRGSAKHLAYNLASFTWPGWNQEGITITVSDLVVGLEAARLNFRLAEELARPDKAKANALWMLGAQQLAAEDFQTAAQTFLRGKSHAHQANETSIERMLHGYAMLARLLAEPTNGVAHTNFQDALTSLKADGSSDAVEYANQLTVALAVFEKPTQRGAAG